MYLCLPCSEAGFSMALQPYTFIPCLTEAPCVCELGKLYKTSVTGLSVSSYRWVAGGLLFCPLSFTLSCLQWADQALLVSALLSSVC